MMNLLEILSPDSVIAPLVAKDKKGVIDELVDLLASVKKVNDARLLKDAVWQREQMRTTGIGAGLAIPHGKCPGMPGLAMAIGRPASPMEFEAIDGQPVRLVVLLASPPLDFHVSDSYFVVAHFHYVLFGVIVFATYSGVYFWFPKMTGRLLDERLAKIHFWLTMIGFNLTFLVQHWLGDEGMPRRYADYLPTDGFTTLNIVSSIGAATLGLSMLPFFWNVFKSWRYGEVVTVDDPWGHGNSLEWATSCPPPRHNFTELPNIRSERPAFELHYPHMIDRMREEAHVGQSHRATRPVAAKIGFDATKPAEYETAKRPSSPRIVIEDRDV